MIITLCGSTRFKDAYIEAMRNETLKGNIVLTVGLFGHLEGIDMGGDVKRMLDKLHLQKISMSHEILVLNVGGYIGESTQREIDYALKIGKIVRYLED